MWETIKSQLIYFFYYFDIQLRQIFIFWIIGIVIGSVISVFAKDKIHNLFEKIQNKNIGVLRNIYSKFIRHFISVMYVWDNTNSGIFFEKWNER